MRQEKINETLISVVESWATTDNPFNSIDEILAWVRKKIAATKVSVRKRHYLYDGREWFYDQAKGEIRHKSGHFFQIKGLKLFADDTLIHEQPIIVQKEIGYLGIIARKIDGILYFLMQAKIEPGNVNVIQISPTIQATKSNFMRVHGGQEPPYLSYFSRADQYEILVDQIQSEHSSRFFGKRNRNIIIVVDDEIEVRDSHRWMTLGQIKKLMQYDNLVNMDTRTVISCIPFALRDYSGTELRHLRHLFCDEALYYSMFFGNSGTDINRVYQFMNDYKMLGQSRICFEDLYGLGTWTYNQEGAFASRDGAFQIIYADIEIEGREVRKWEQPLLEAVGPSVFGLIYREENGIKQYLIHTKPEVGCFDGIEAGPSIQSGPLDQADGPVENLFFENLSRGKGVEFDHLFSEEGGRFFHEQNRNIIMRIEKDELREALPKGYFWLDYHTLNILIQFNNCLNIQLRNLLSILPI